MQEWYGDLSNMTKRYGMPPKVGKKKKKDTEYLAGVYERLGSKAQTKYRWKSKWGVTAKAAAKDIVSPFSIIKGKLKNDPLGQND